MKKNIKIAFHTNMSDEMVRFIMTTLRRQFDVQRVYISQNYDYYFAQESIYFDHKSMLRFLKCKKDAIKIMICKEDIYPDLNLFDYAIMLHKHNLQVDDRVLYWNAIDTLNKDESGEFNDFCNVFYKIFRQNKREAVRKPEGTWPDIWYPCFWETICNGDKSQNIAALYINKIYECMRRVIC